MSGSEDAATMAVIVASGANGVIGHRGVMPWRLPEDLRLFKRLTLGKPVIMGRRTYESLPKRPLPERLNIVLSRCQPTTKTAGVHYARSLEAALARARDGAMAGGEIFVIGGAEVYRQALPLARRLYWTRVEAAPAGDARIDIDIADWEEEEELLAADAACDGQPAFRCARYARKTAARGDNALL